MVREEIFKAENGDRSNAPNVAVVITDGESNVKQKMTIPEAKKVHNAGIIVIAVGISNNISVPELKGIASDPDKDHLFKVDSYNELVKVQKKIANETCKQTKGKYTYMAGKGYPL